MVSKLEMRFGTLWGTLLGSILEDFGVPLGSHGASLWEKRGSRLKCIWNLGKPVCGELREILGDPRLVPINHHSSSLLGAFLEPSGRSSSGLGASRDRWIVDCKIPRASGPPGIVGLWKKKLDWNSPATPHRASGTVADIQDALRRGTTASIVSD